MKQEEEEHDNDREEECCTAPGRAAPLTHRSVLVLEGHHHQHQQHRPWSKHTAGIPVPAGTSHMVQHHDPHDSNQEDHHQLVVPAHTHSTEAHTMFSGSTYQEYRYSCQLASLPS